MSCDRSLSPADLPITTPVSLAEFGALIGDPIRAAILHHLSDGSRRPASELALLAGASSQSASAHLARLLDGGLLAVERQGRHRFFRIASGDVAEMIESLGNWIDRPRRPSRHDPALCQARLCYDHLAGRLGVAVFDRMIGRGLLALGSDGPSLTPAGDIWRRRVGLDDAPPPRSPRPLLRLCLDWTERRHHLGGHLGAALARMMVEARFVIAGPKRRSLLVTARGALFLQDELALEILGPGWPAISLIAPAPPNAS